MADSSLAELIAAAEAGDARYPKNPAPGLRGEAARLDRAEQLVFAEDDAVPEFFAKLTEVPATSPLAPRAQRLRLLRTNREKLKGVLEPDNPHSGRIFGALAVGPGPTMAKRYFQDDLADGESMHLVSDLRRAFASKAYPIYSAERAWLKKVGPSRKTTGWDRFKDRAGSWWENSKGEAIFVTILLVVLAIGFFSGHMPIGGAAIAIYFFVKRSRSA